MKTEGILVGIYQMPNQYSAVTACYSDITPRLRRRASLSMFISLETRHFVWDSKLFLFYFLLSCCLARFVFSTKQSWKKLAPNFADRFGQSGRPRVQWDREISRWSRTTYMHSHLPTYYQFAVASEQKYNIQNRFSLFAMSRWAMRDEGWGMRMRGWVWMRISVSSL